MVAVHAGAVIVCLLADPPEVNCRTEVFRTEHTVEQCRAMLKPVGEWIKAASAWACAAAWAASRVG